MEKQEEFMQIGVAALRNPATGEFYPSFPIYMRANDEAIASRDKVLSCIGQLFADKIKQYVNECRQAGIEI